MYRACRLNSIAATKDAQTKMYRQNALSAVFLPADERPSQFALYGLRDLSLCSEKSCQAESMGFIQREPV